MPNESESPGDRVIVLDRDGVINRESDAFIKTPDEWQALPDSLKAIAELHNAGFTVIVATNQSGVGRGLFDEAMLDTIHAKMLNEVRAAGGDIAAIFVCPHAPDAGCDCRKPLPGLLRQIEQQLGINLSGVPIVGDSKRDLDAALAVTARPVLVRTGNGKNTERDLGAMHSIDVYDTLADVAAALTVKRF